MAKTWEEAMNMSDAIASAGAANETAMKQAAGELGSTAEEWSSVRTRLRLQTVPEFLHGAQITVRIQNQVEEVIRIAREWNQNSGRIRQKESRPRHQPRMK